MPVVILSGKINLPIGPFASDPDSRLSKAAFDGDIAELERLLASGAELNHQVGEGVTALIMASQNAHRTIVEALLVKGAAVDVQFEDGATALTIASYKGHTKIVATLLSKGADTELQVEDGSTALDLAKSETIRNMIRMAAQP